MKLQIDNSLRLLRKQRKMSQLTLQIATGIEQALLSKSETGKRVPPTETLILLSDFYGVSIDYILKRTDNPEINR
ncbi:MAG: helix-turn-helix transcriptional regulator [Clostridiales bacterium]|nr:helix-turn-helix transcriptional regulator [Clostridiales bacterium]